ncbi:MAG: hypothetical protein OXH13_11035 [Chloroflexi bacterium]|nr:hypothetical protein [Chloroflexota bacterium]MCY3697937.1 hypothetical protein [Chloroflexota bacterium]MXX81017.1 hypothetical protein [Chloroflexota bacterium]MYB22194.1 hypothetical protein [Chloroflexota bacterium]MYF21701.1 hypothetical protein [Chloroflexota bacterium]
MLRLLRRGGRGHAQAVDQVQELLTVDGPTGSEAAAATRQDRLFDLFDQFKQVDDELLPRAPRRITLVSTLAQ